jgi:hypothetical protein
VAQPVTKAQHLAHRPSPNLVPNRHQAITQPTSTMQELWDSYRRVIEDLYLKDDKALKEVMSVMEQNYGFQAR